MANLKRDADGYLRRSVQDLFSLSERTIVITGGARGIGLAFAFAIAESGGNVAVLDVAEEPHAHFQLLSKRFPKQRFKPYKCVSWPSISNNVATTNTLSLLVGPMSPTMRR